jgi:elongation of very long chain fatty acids protein 4
MQAYNSFVKLLSPLRAVGHDLVVLSNPDLSSPSAFSKRALAGWPLIELDEAFVWVILYAILIAYGLATRPSDGKEASKPEKKSSKSVLAILYNEPIKILMALYNLVQVLLCGYMMVEAARVAFQNYSLTICNPHVNTTKSKLAPVLWLFYVSKVLDFADTFFIVVRGSWSQFSFLHVYHHFSIFLTYWLVANAGPDGDVFYTIVANSFIHLVMYTYYGCSVFGFKPFANVVTELQLAQFVTMMSQAIYILSQGCPYPQRVTAFYLGYILSLFLLFSSFYAAKYLSGGSSKKPKSKSG